MKLFVDTANVKEIEALASLGILDGVTTNPSLLAKESGDYRQILKRMCQVVQGPVSAEVVATDTDGMVREGRDLASIDEHIVIKVPFTRDGVRACKTLASEGRRVNVTLIFSAAQAWLAAKVGAAYVSPFVGRLDDIGTTGMNLIREIVEKTGAKVDISDDGTVKVASSDGKAIDAALNWIKSITAEPEVGTIYQGTVVKVVDFGAFVNFFGARDGLVHISQLAPHRVAKTSDVVNEGDKVWVKLLGFDDRGKVRLSMKMIDQESGQETADEDSNE